LKVYFANLAGFEKLPWNDRITKSTELFEHYLDLFYNNKDKFYEALSLVSEPYKFINIFIAKEKFFIF